MLARTARRYAGSVSYGGWPWPSKLPMRPSWFTRLSRRTSIADETRQYFVVGDVLLLLVVAFSAYRVFWLACRQNAYQTHMCALTNYPPAIIANEFDFADAQSNRTVDRHALDAYREAVVACRARGAPVEHVIFQY